MAMLELFLDQIPEHNSRTAGLTPACPGLPVEEKLSIKDFLINFMVQKEANLD